MDKGLDIELLTCMLALHAVLYFNPDALSNCLASLQCQTRSGASTFRLRQFAETLARNARVEMPDWSAADAALAWRGPERVILTSLHQEYPPLLRTIASPPPVLFVHGDPSLLSAPQIAIIGSRNATPTGREIAHRLAAELCSVQFRITSGMARGIDSAAHRGALAVDGRTLAIYGSGIDRVYPRTNAQLAADIVDRGALVSEFPLGAPPIARHFPLRNRIISGIAVGTVVVEAGLASGSLITAQCALEQGREVFAVPGSTRNPLTRGCHALIKQGAQLVETAADIMEALPLHALRHLAGALSPPESQLTPEIYEDRSADAVIEALSYEPVDLDTLIERTGLTHKVLSSILLALELSGSVRALASGYYERIAPSRRRLL